LVKEDATELSQICKGCCRARDAGLNAGL